MSALPPDLVPLCGHSDFKCVFTTSQQYTGNLGGLTGADSICQNLATMSHLGGTYKAWLGDGTNSPATRFNLATVPYQLIDRTVVAASWAALVGATVDMGLAHAISLTERGTTAPLGTNDCSKTTPVWSNTDRNGNTYPYSCSGWTSGMSTVKGGQGTWSQTGGGWTDSCGQTNCGGLAALYCFEQ